MTDDYNEQDMLDAIRYSLGRISRASSSELDLRPGGVNAINPPMTILKRGDIVVRKFADEDSGKRELINIAANTHGENTHWLVMLGILCGGRAEISVNTLSQFMKTNAAPWSIQVSQRMDTLVYEFNVMYNDVPVTALLEIEADKLNDAEQAAAAWLRQALGEPVDIDTLTRAIDSADEEIERAWRQRRHEQQVLSKEG